MGENVASAVLCTVLCRVLSFDGLCKIPDVNIFKRLLLPRFAFNFNHSLEKACSPGTYRPLHFLVICQTLSIWHGEVTSATLPLSIKLSGFIWRKVKQSVKAPGLFVFVFSDCSAECCFWQCQLLM